MAEKELFIKELRDGLYLLDEAHAATGYLLIGEEKACVIDTMLGHNNLYEVVRRYTDKPIVVVNTHGHPDHIFGNIYYEKAFMNPKDLELAKGFIEGDEEFVDLCKKEGLSMPPFEDIAEGDVINLGGRTLEVYDIPGHTPGGILLLCPEERLLFTGDSINHHLWMQLPESSSIKALAESIERIMFLEDKADFILHGHAQDFDDISLLRSMYDGAVSLAKGDTSNDMDYHWFAGVSRQHPFIMKGDENADPKAHVICYDVSKL